ncbi:MAG: hypothetical protein FWE86_02680 [Oscillospiraceae bacterium]|nr:hypothetical protein [Oscillospiraceae bacterium]
MARSKRAKEKAKKKLEKLSQRQSYEKMFDRTCERVYRLCYDRTHNRRDADMVLRDAFVMMYENIGSLRKSVSLDSWQRQWIEKAFRELIRSGLLTLIRDEQPEDIDSITVDDEKKGDLWNLMTKMAEIDPWRLMPVPGKSSLLSVLADQTMSDMRYMSAADYVKLAGAVTAAVAVLAVGVQYGIKFIESRRGIPTEPPAEIFLDESLYAGESGWNDQSVDRDMIDGIINSAIKTTTTKKDYDKNSLNYHPQGNIGHSARGPISTGSLLLDFKLQAIVWDVTRGKTNDYEILRALYVHVGGSMTYVPPVRDDAKYTPDIVELAEIWMDEQAGDSAVYSGALAALCRAAGYKCDVVKGYFMFNKGTDFERQSLHYWNRVNINGTEYYMDLEADSSGDGAEVRGYYFLAAMGNPRWPVYNRDHGTVLGVFG